MPLNPLQMNDWKIGTTLKVVIGVQVSVWALIGLDAAGLPLPLLRGLLTMPYLLFIPGALVLRVLRLHHLGSVRTLLFAVGLSITTLMLTGLFMTTLYPLLGVARPLSLAPVTLTMGGVITLLAVLSYGRDRAATGSDVLAWRELLSPPALVFCLLPFISVLGAYAMNVYHSNVILLGLVFAVAAAALWAAASSSFPRRLYPLAVFVCALSLLYHASLISSYVWGWDIQQEFFSANMVSTTGVWDWLAAGQTNSVLSIALLAPLLSTMSGVSIVWIFKAIYPLLFALVPLGLFVVFQKQTNARIALLASFFVTFLFTFFSELPALGRQEIAELFLVLLLIVLVDKRIGASTGKIPVYIVGALCAASLIVSHYALAIVALVYLVIAWLLIFLIDNPAMRRLRANAPTESAQIHGRERMLTLPFILSFAALMALWYTSFGSAALSEGIAPTLASVNGVLFTSVGLPLVIGLAAVLYTGALAIVYLVAVRAQRHPRTLTWWFSALPLVVSVPLLVAAHPLALSVNELLRPGTLSPLHEAARFLYLLGLALITVGLTALLRRRCRWAFDKEYVALALASFAVLLAGTIVPSLGMIMNTTRLYHISTIFLAPFCVTGALALSQARHYRHGGQHTQTGSRRVFQFIAILFVIMMLFSTGLVYEVSRQDPTSFFLNDAIDAARFSEQEVVAAQWLASARSSPTDTKNASPVYADVYRGLLWTSVDSDRSLTNLPYMTFKTPHDGYIYLGTFNLLTGTKAQTNARSFLNGTLVFHSSTAGVADNRYRIFDDGGAVIYYR